MKQKSLINTANINNPTENYFQKFNSILLIDDDAINNFISVNLLKKLSSCSNIHVFKNGKEALDFIQKNSQKERFPSLIFLDMHMPIMDGYDFASELVKRIPNEEIKIVMLSTSMRETDKEKLKSMNIHSFMNKPLTEEKLADLINKIESLT